MTEAVTLVRFTTTVPPSQLREWAKKWSRTGRYSFLGLFGRNCQDRLLLAVYPFSVAAALRLHARGGVMGQCTAASLVGFSAAYWCTRRRRGVRNDIELLFVER